jgi:hypothetical protein
MKFEIQVQRGEHRVCRCSSGLGPDDRKPTGPELEFWAEIQRLQAKLSWIYDNCERSCFNGFRGKRGG